MSMFVCENKQNLGLNIYNYIWHDIVVTSKSSYKNNSGKAMLFGLFILIHIPVSDP